MTEPDTPHVAALYRYPVKGLSPENLPRIVLSPGATFPADRLYAIENGPSGFDPEKPSYLPKTQFLMLMRNERLAALRTRYDEDKHCLTIELNGRDVEEGDLRTAFGRENIENFFRDYCAAELRGPPRVLAAPDHSFSDVAAKVVSIINLASVRALESVIGRPVDPLRFRGNMHVEGWPAWHEFTLLGQTIAIGQVRLKIVKRIVRCAATNVDPQSAARDMEIPKTLLQTYGHADCGVYAQVVTGGTIAEGDAIDNTVAQPRLI